MPERFLIRTEGGPCDGETRVCNGDDGTGYVWQWPLPDVLKYDSTGRYVKVMQSDLPPQDEDSRILRGATYQWEAASSIRPYLKETPDVIH